jgi:heme/copper-type cytochrome/quinol oxidase subunit 4
MFRTLLAHHQERWNCIYSLWCCYIMVILCVFNSLWCIHSFTLFSVYPYTGNHTKDVEIVIVVVIKI